MTAPMMHLLIGHNSHVGRVRERNEDSYLVLTAPAVSAPIDALVVVADGVGGANAGDVASGKLVEALWSWFGNNTYGEQVDFDHEHEDYFLVVLKDLLERINEHLFEMAQTTPEWRSMGTTATVGILSNGRFFLAHAGDTRAYLLRQGELQQLTADHSWVAAEVAAGRLTTEEAKRHPRRNVIMRVLGNQLVFRTDRETHHTQGEDLFILTSDGLTGFATDEEIRHSFLTHNYPQQACDELVALANRRGGGDNVTIIAIRLFPADNRYAPSNLPHGVAVSSAYLGYPAVLAPPATSPASEAETAPVKAVSRTESSQPTSTPHPSQVDTQKIPTISQKVAEQAEQETIKLPKPEENYDHLITQVLDRNQLESALSAENQPELTQPTSQPGNSSAPTWLFFLLPTLTLIGGIPLLALLIPTTSGVFRWLLVAVILTLIVIIGFWSGGQSQVASNLTSLESVE